MYAIKIDFDEYRIALLDAAASQSVNPSFSRGKAREGEAFNRLQDYESCHKACMFYIPVVDIRENGLY